MTSQSPRIYLYKITFEEVPYYYYGVKKEKKFNEYYMGSPITHKWCWEFYTPKKQILQFFEYNDKGWIQAQEVEKRLIKPFYNTDKWCLNENVGGFVSLSSLSKLGTKLYENKLGMFSRTEEQFISDCKKGGKIAGKQVYDSGKGLFKLTEEEKLENCKKGGLIMGKKTKELGIGIHKLTKEERVLNGKKYGGKGGNSTAEKYSRSFSLISPDGELVNGKNLTKFCKEKNLSRSNVQAVLRGDRNQHKGWKKA